MRFSEVTRTGSIMRQKMTRSKYIVVLAVVAGAILTLGMLLKPAREAPQVAISESEMVRIQKLSQKKTLEDMTSYFADIARETVVHLVRLNDYEASGLVWDAQGRIVTAEPLMRPAQVASILTSEGVEVPAKTSISSPDIPVGALQASLVPGMEPVTMSPLDRIQPGAWVVQVSLRPEGGHLFAPGVYSGTVPRFCGGYQYRELRISLPLGATAAGGGLFDIDGGLLGVVVHCGQSYAALAVDDVNRALVMADTFEEKLMQGYGMRVVPLDARSTAHFKISEGALVSEVYSGTLADSAGIAPGDVLVNLDGDPVKIPEDLQKLLLPVARVMFDFRVRRGQRRVSVKLRAYDPEGPNGNRSALGLHLQQPEQGFLIAKVEQGSPADRAGIQPGDRVITVNGRRPANFAAMNKLISSPRVEPDYVVVARGDRKLGLLLR